MANDAALEFVAVTRRFGASTAAEPSSGTASGRTRGQVTALDRCSFVLRRGECMLVQGPSGSGKSTLLALACGLLLPTEGTVRFLQHELSRSKESFRAQNRRENMAIVLQDLALIASMSVRENALLATALSGLSKAQREARERQLLAALERFDIQALQDQSITTLSGGERQRVALARAAMSPQAALLVLDEPTARLDLDNVERVSDWIVERLAADKAVLIATHDDRLIARLPNAIHYTLRGGTLSQDSPT
jgi:putative ABC transport system ATP-binding protein